ncbi:MAG: hypothetical protein ACTTJS_04065 [Wolinella sp.]
MARTIKIETLGVGNGTWEMEGEFREWGSPEIQEGFKIKPSIGVFQIVNSRIEYLMNYAVLEHMIEDAKEDPLFQEVCEFVCPQYDGRFIGTWVDALIYIDKITDKEAKGIHPYKAQSKE